MDHSEIPLILQELNLIEDDVTNIYHHGSWVYGTNSPTSDRDLLIVARLSESNPLNFWTDFDYFHDFKHYKLWNKYDITVYTVEHFEILLEKSYLIAVQCIFLPDEFKIKEIIDYRRIYLEKYFNTLRIKQAAFYEMYRDWKLYKPENNSSSDVISNERILSRQNYIFKHLFHGLRYLDFAEQLIQTRSIYNYKRITYIFEEMKHIRGDPIDNSSMKRVAEFVQIKMIELKLKLDTLVSTNIVKGSFEAYIIFDCTHHTEQIIDKLKKTCENTKYNIFVIQLDADQNEDKHEQLIVTSNYNGEYPLIIKQIENEISQDFQDFNIIRIKIESSTSNKGIPDTYIDKKLFWNRTNYFEFHYKLPLDKDQKGLKLKKFINTYQSKHRLNLDFSRITFKQIDEMYSPYINIIRLYNVGREKAFHINDQILEDSTKNNIPLSIIKHRFIVYDTYSNSQNENEDK